MLVSRADRANAGGQWPEAEADYAAALAIDDKRPEIWVQYGHALKEQGFLRGAEDAYRRAILHRPRDADSHLQLGHLLQLAGRPREAAAAYRAASDLDPVLESARREREKLEAELAEGVWQAAGTTGSASTGNLVCDTAIAALLAEHGMCAAVLEVFDHRFYYFLNAPVRRRLARPDMLQCLQDFLEHGIDALLPCRFGQVFDPLFYRTRYLHRMPFTAVNAYRHWLQIGVARDWAANKEDWLRRQLGFDAGRVDAMDPDFVELLTGSSEPRPWREWFDRFVTDAIARRSPEGETEAERDFVYLNLFAAAADRLEKGGQSDEAVALLQRVLRRSPGLVRARSAYADALLRRACPLGAEALYRETIEGGDASALTHRNRATCFEDLGDLRAALEAMSHSCRAFPGNLELLRRFDEIAESSLSREWALATAEARAGHMKDAQARLAVATAWVAGLIAAPARQPSRPVRQVALVGNFGIAQCRFYRIDQKVEQLRQAGYAVDVYDWATDLPRFAGEMYRFQAVIFYRVSAIYAVMRVITQARALGLVTFYEIDDLLFDSAEYPDTLESYGGQIELEEYIGLQLGVPLFAQALSMCEHAIASTPSLARRMAKLVPGEAFVHRNAFGSAHVRSMAAARRDWSGDRVTVFYGSGTKAHKADFQELAEPALIELVRRHRGRVNILLVGYASMTERLASIADHVTLVGPVWDVDDYWALLMCVDINIAVLKPSPMSDCKSEIKWLEAAMFAVPSVVSDTATYREVVEPGVTGLLCRDVAEWTEALDRLVRDRALRRRIGQAAQARIEAHYGLAEMAANLDRILQKTAPAAVVPRAKIVVVNVFYPPQAIGGATRVVHDNVRDLQGADAAFDIEVFSTIEGGLEPYRLSSHVEDGVRVTGITTPALADIDRLLSDPLMGTAFDAYLEEVKPALVHFHCIQRLTIEVVKAVQARGIPYLVTVHDGWWISDRQFLLDADDRLALYDYADPAGVLCRLGSDAHRRMMRLRAPLLDAEQVLAVSDAFAAIYRGCGVPHVSTVANGLSDLPATERTISADGRVRLGFVGGLEPHKGGWLIRCALETGVFPRLHLTIIDHAMAAGDRRQEIWGETEVEFLPKWPQSRVGALYGRLDVLLALSIWPESFGLVTREAIASGCWVVASDRGAVGEDVCDGLNGYVIDVATPDPLAAVLARIQAEPARYLRPPPPAPTPLRPASDQARELAMLYSRLLGPAQVAAGPVLAGESK